MRPFTMLFPFKYNPCAGPTQPKSNVDIGLLDEVTEQRTDTYQVILKSSSFTLVELEHIIRAGIQVPDLVRLELTYGEGGAEPEEVSGIRLLYDERRADTPPRPPDLGVEIPT